MSIAIEAVELMELFQWTLENESLDGKKLAEIRHELADVVFYCLSMVNVTKIDLSEAVLEKMKMNARKYPI
jgi:NTP pyrophosphatase (non-canonical NTP hydrolase)